MRGIGAQRKEASKSDSSRAKRLGGGEDGAELSPERSGKEIRPARQAAKPATFGGADETGR